MKNDRYKNYKGEALDEKIIKDYNLNKTEYYKIKSKLKEGGAVGWYDVAMTITHIYKKKEEALNKLSNDMKKKKIPKDKIQEVLSKAKEKLNKWK